MFTGDVRAGGGREVLLGRCERDMREYDLKERVRKGMERYE